MDDEEKPQTWTGEEPILDFGGGEEPLTLGATWEHLGLYGRSGAGKSSGPLAAIVKGLLSHGVGILYFCVKPDASEDIEKWAAETGRTEDLLFFGRDDSLRFNPIAFMAERGTGGETMAIAQLVEALMGIVNPNQGGEAFWKNARSELLKSSIDLLRLSGEEVSLENIMNLVASAPNENTKLSHPDWKASYCAQRIEAASKAAMGTKDERDFSMCERYFTATFRNMGDRTRGTVVSDLTGLVDGLLRGSAGRLFSTDTNVTPEALAEGKIVVVDFPVLTYQLAGRLINGGWKYCAQQYFQTLSAERRHNPEARPVALVVDEAQYLCLGNGVDMMAMSTLRSSKLSVILASQNFSTFHALLGHSAEHEVNSIFGNIGTFFFGSNTSYSTYRWIADLLGDKIVTLGGSSTTQGYKTPIDFIPSISDSRSVSEQFRPVLRQEDFLRLKTGGPRHDYIVENYVVQAGREWRNGELFKKVAFDQRA